MRLQSLIVHATQKVYVLVIPGEHMQLVNIAGRLFNCAKIATATDEVEKLSLHHGAGAAGVVVEHNRQVNSTVDHQRMIGKLAL